MIPFLNSRAALFVTLFALSVCTQISAKGLEDRGTLAMPGFYVQISMFHASAYPDWQKEAASSLRKSGVTVFASEDISDYTSNQPWVVLRTLPLRGIGDEGWPTPIYAGPFTTDKEARQLISKLPKILQGEIAKSRKASGEPNHGPTGFKNCSGNSCLLEGYIVALVQYKP